MVEVDTLSLSLDTHCDRSQVCTVITQHKKWACYKSSYERNACYSRHRQHTIASMTEMENLNLIPNSLKQWVVETQQQVGKAQFRYLQRVPVEFYKWKLFIFSREPRMIRILEDIHSKMRVLLSLISARSSHHPPPPPPPPSTCVVCYSHCCLSFIFNSSFQHHWAVRVDDDDDAVHKWKWEGRGKLFRYENNKNNETKKRNNFKSKLHNTKIVLVLREFCTKYISRSLWVEAKQLE